jgi:hypothetical protein
MFTTLLLSCMSASKPRNGNPTLNYIEYNRGKSFPVYSDLYISSQNSQLKFHHLYFQDDSFFPDNSIFPNAFLKPLLELRLGDASDAFTEPYYGFRFIHFLNKNPRWGIGIEFIHHKIFLNDPDQQVRITGVIEGNQIDKVDTIKNYLEYFSISHGINHVGVAVVYRFMLLPTEKIPDGRLQPFFTFTFGPTIPHLEVKMKGSESEWDAYSYQAGLKNFGGGLGMGLRFKPWRHFGFYLEYKLTYSHLQGMHFDQEESDVQMDFFTHHIQWGMSYMF